jgi:hypothetical protein
MKSKFLYISTIFAALILVLIYACQKDSSAGLSDNTAFSANSVEKSAVVATTTFDELNDFAQSGFDANNLKSLNLTFGNCPAISVNFTTPPFSISLDWGTGCKSGDGVTRSGKINMSLTGNMGEKNSVATMKIENFMVDDRKITGVTKITYLGLNANNNWPRYSVLTEGKIEFADKSIVTYRSEFVRLQSTGAGTAPILDDTWRMEGSSSGVHKDGTKLTARTTKVIIKKGECKWYGSGIFEITPEKGNIKTIDFGDGTCDNIAKMTVGDKVTEIKL